MATKYVPHGTIPANLMPFREDYEINEPELRRHLRWLAAVPGVTAITQNGHAAETASMTREEKRRALAVALEEIGDRLPVIAGVFCDGSFEAAQLAQDAQAEGASAILVPPPSFFNWGSQLRPEMAYTHFATIAAAVEIPIVVFQYPVAQGYGYSPETLVMLAERIDTVVAVKDWSQDIVAYERNVRALRSLPRKVAMLTTYSAALLATLTVGADGLLSGMGSVVADLQADLFAAVQRGDLTAARAINDRLYPLAQAFYAPPFLDMHNRMKVALVQLGRLERAVVRPPLVTPPAADQDRIRQALGAAGLLETGVAVGATPTR
ncbi:MAG: dihydrodipicolinate synthase family protein [Chloroflexi bacterium]|nr:dihydrodipicolinate synthase family protein [Chloroflexota bacterium]